MNSSYRIQVPVAVGTPLEQIAVTNGVLHYSDDDPYVVAFEITQPGTKDEFVTWHIGRDLLAAGYCSYGKPVGEGDMRIWRCDNGNGLHFEMRSPYGTATLHVAPYLVEEFLSESYSLVAEGKESVDVDAWIGRILEGQA